MTAWLVVLAVGAGSYLFRVSMLVVAAHTTLPPVVERAATYAAPVSCAALAATTLAEHAGADGATTAAVVSVAVAVAAVRRTGSAHAALVAGMPAYWLLAALLT